jgi:hypothetical protein
MIDSPRKVQLVRSSVTGHQPMNGFWSSDHVVVVSTLKLR